MIFRRLFLILIIISSAAFAADPEYFFYVTSPEEVDSYSNIFNAIAKIFGSNDYLDLLKLVFLFGGFLTFAKGLISLGGTYIESHEPAEIKSETGGIAIKNYTGYILVVTSILLIIFAQTATVVIKTHKIPSYCSSHISSTTGVAIDNVPEIVAYTFNFMNKMGTSFTSLSESAFSVPSDTYGSYLMSDNEGYLGALKNAMIIMGVDTSKKLENGEPTTSYDLPKAVSVLFSQCILIPFSAKGQTGLDEITKMKASSNLFQYLDNLYTTNPSIGGILARDYQANFGGETWKCGDLWDNILKPNLEDYKNNVDCLYPEVNKGALQLITGQANPPKSTFHETVLQSALISELQKTKSILGTGITGTNYSIGKSKSEFIQSKLAEGAYTAQMLPYIQSTLRSLLYAMFPFVFVIVIFPGGLKVISEYAKSLIWIEMWTPTAAILNMFISQHAQDKLGSTFQADNGLTLLNSVDMLTNGSAIAGTAGYLYASVPALTWLFLTGSEAMLSNFGAGMSSYMLKNIRTEEFLKDTTEISKQKEIQNQTGEDISIAEIQHYEAIQEGTIQGAILGEQQNLGLDRLKEHSVYKTNKDVKSFLALKEATGSVNGESLANTEAAANAVDKGGKLKAVRETVQDSDGSFNLNEAGQTVVEQDSFQAGAEMEAKAQHQLSEDQYLMAELSERQDYQTKGEILANRIKHDIANGVVMKDENGNPDISRYINRFARTDGYLAAHKQEVAQITAQKLEMLETDINTDGTPTVHYGTGANYANSEASVGARNITSQIANDQELTRQGVSGRRQGTAQADATARTVGQTETIKHLVQQHYGTNMIGLGSMESQTIKVGNNETTYAEDGTMIHNRQTKIGSFSSQGFEYYADSAEHAASRQYIISILKDFNLLFGLFIDKPTKLNRKIKRMKKKKIRLKERKTNKHLKEKMKYNKMSRKERKAFHAMLEDARALGITEKELQKAMSLKDLEDQIEAKRTSKSKKLAEKISEKAAHLKNGIKSAPKFVVQAVTHAPAFAVKGSSKFMLKITKGATKGVVGVFSVFAAEGLDATNTRLGHAGAEAIRTVDDIAWGGIKALWHSGNAIGFALTGDFDSAKNALNSVANDLEEAYDKTKEHLSEAYDSTASAVKDAYKYVENGELSHDIDKAVDYFEKGEFAKDVDHAVEYVQSGELKKDIEQTVDTIKSVTESVSKELESTFDETVDYYKTHSAKEVWNDVTSFFK